MFPSIPDSIQELLQAHSIQQNKEILDALHTAHKGLELAINNTPTGDVRNALCDANILAIQTLMNNNYKIM